MHNWVNENYYTAAVGRSSIYFGTAITSREGVDNFATFDQVLEVIQLNSPLACIVYYPFKISDEALNENTPTALRTAKHEFSTVPAVTPSAQQMYLYLGEYYVDPGDDFLSSSGYTKLQVYLPYLGIFDIDVNSVLDKWLQFRICVDIPTGAATYVIGATSSAMSIINAGDTYGSGARLGDPDADNAAFTEIVGFYDVQIGIQMPLGESGFADLVRNNIMAGVKITGTVAGAVAPASPAASAPSVTTVSKVSSTKERNPNTGRLVTVQSHEETETSIKEKSVPTQSVANEIQASASDVISLFRSGGGSSDRCNMGASSAILSPCVHVIKTRPQVVAVDEDYARVNGLPAGYTVQLSELEGMGYTEISAVRFHAQPETLITKSEMQELEALLRGGVIL